MGQGAHKQPKAVKESVTMIQMSTQCMPLASDWCVEFLCQAERLLLRYFPHANGWKFADSSAAFSGSCVPGWTQSQSAVHAIHEPLDTVFCWLRGLLLRCQSLCKGGSKSSKFNNVSQALVVTERTQPQLGRQIPVESHLHSHLRKWYNEQS